MFLTERTIIVLHGALGSAAQMARVPFTIAGFADWLRAALEPVAAPPPLDPPALASVRARVMLGVGDADDTVDAAETERFTAMIRGATSRVVPGTPHPIERVAPDQVVSLVRDVSGG